MKSPHLLDVQNLTVGFTSDTGEAIVVDHISFALNESETLAVVGESGSGKTVTALAVLKLIPSPPGKIISGNVLFRNSEGLITDLMPLDERRMQKIRGCSISMIFQEPMTSLNPVFTCGNQVAESLRAHLAMNKKTAREKVLDLFNEVMLPRPAAVFKAYPHLLSGGQKQRVMIAMAIACNPAVLIADEPTTALDVTVQKAILDLMKKLQESRKMSILFITHDLGVVAGFADRVLVMNKGKIVEEGTTGEIFQNPEHPYTRGLLACRPPLNIRLNRLPTVEKYILDERPSSDGIITPQQRKKEHERLYGQDPILKVEKLTKQFGSFTALEKASFLVYPGETLGIVGESGSGKTTLARVVLELIPATEGRIVYQEQDITKLTAGKLQKMRKDLQIIFQDPYSSLNPRFAIGPAILEPMKVHRLHRHDKERKDRVMELLQKVGLKQEHYYRYPHEFSGGQRQRICIARALAVEPRLIICDESVSALDVSIQAQVLNLLNDLKKDFGLTYIFISHDLSVVKYMSDRLIVMKNGKIEEMGEADEVYDKPRSEYTKALLEAIPGGQGDEGTGGRGG
ncbi:MAG: ABC transporter ATP-binding protein [Bacteroidales bacterium]|nr:ABC transporter ATP-binding protein [Bacteroidales bacterium]